MSSNIDSEIIKNLRSSGDQNKLEQTTFSSMVLNDTTIKGGNNKVTERLRYNRSKRKDIPEQDSSLIVLFKKDNNLYVGGDRGQPELVYELESDYNYVGTPNINKIGKKNNDWLINFILQNQTNPDNYIFCVATSGDLVKSPVTIPRGINGNTFSGDGELGISCFQHGYFSSISISDSFLAPDSSPLCSFYSGLEQPFLIVRVLVTVTFDGLSFILNQDLDGFIPPIFIDSSEFVNYDGYYDGSDFFPLAGSSGGILVLLSYGSSLSDVYIENTVIDTDLSYRDNHLNSAFGGRYSLDKVSIFRNGDVFIYSAGGSVGSLNSSAYCAFVSTHRSLGLDVINNKDIRIEYISLLTGENKTLPFEYSFGKTIDARQVSNADTSFIPRTRDEPFCIGSDQESVILKIYNEEAYEFQFQFIQGSDSVLLNEEDFEGVFSSTAKSLNLIGNKIYAVSSFPDDELSGVVDVFTASIEGNTVINSTDSVEFFGITDDLKTSIIDASAYL